MSHLSALKELPKNESDNYEWSHVTERAERRKIQNRINQRNHRRRQKPSPSKDKPTCWKYIGSLGEETDTSPPNDISVISPGSCDSTSESNTTSAVSHIQPSAIDCRLAPEGASEYVTQFELAAYQSYFKGCPTADHLLTLVKLNVYRALSENLAALGMDMGWMKADISLLCALQPPGLKWDIPSHLRPTAIQRSVLHHPWLDFFPHPKMRDCLIIAGESLDEDELCRDLMGFWDSGKEHTGLIVWGHPWLIENWEMSEGFLTKWSWTIQGCPELFRSTNHWRLLRGENKLPPSYYK